MANETLMTAPRETVKVAGINPPPVRNRGWRVTFAGTDINLALGILPGLSMIKGAIREEFAGKVSGPAILVFSADLSESSVKRPSRNLSFLMNNS